MLENSYLIMNRQTWTNEKRYLGMADSMEEANGPLCALCRGLANTMHLMFECKQYSEPLWKLLEQDVNITLRTSNSKQTRNACLFGNIQYMDRCAMQPGRCNMALIQEIKRNIVYRRYTRETTNRAIHCNCARLLAHPLITVKKLESLRKYQGKNNTFFT
jgi:hypothetical protein